MRSSVWTPRQARFGNTPTPYLTWTQVLVYLDDIIVLGKSIENGLRNLRNVLYRFREFNLKLKPKKCELFKDEVEFLGKLVSAKYQTVATKP
jgi:hypothetical protein